MNTKYSFLSKNSRALKFGISFFALYELIGYLVDPFVYPLWRYLLSFVLSLAGGFLVQYHTDSRKKKLESKEHLGSIDSFIDRNYQALKWGFGAFIFFEGILYFTKQEVYPYWRYFLSFCICIAAGFLVHLVVHRSKLH